MEPITVKCLDSFISLINALLTGVWSVDLVQVWNSSIYRKTALSIYGRYGCRDGAPPALGFPVLRIESHKQTVLFQKVKLPGRLNLIPCPVRV